MNNITRGGRVVSTPLHIKEPEPKSCLCGSPLNDKGECEGNGYTVKVGESDA